MEKSKDEAGGYGTKFRAFHLESEIWIRKRERTERKHTNEDDYR